jgi:lactoylglutathione lyase
MKIEHIAIWTTNLERLKAFYVQYFGATSNALYHNETKQFKSYFLTFADGARLEIMSRVDVNQAPTSELLGYAHLAMAVGSPTAVDQLTVQLAEAGYTVVGEPRTTGDGYYESVILDPDGNRIEITA